MADQEQGQGPGPAEHDFDQLDVDLFGSDLSTLGSPSTSQEVDGDTTEAEDVNMEDEKGNECEIHDDKAENENETKAQTGEQSESQISDHAFDQTNDSTDESTEDDSESEARDPNDLDSDTLDEYWVDRAVEMASADARDEAVVDAMGLNHDADRDIPDQRIGQTSHFTSAHMNRLTFPTGLPVAPLNAEDSRINARNVALGEQMVVKEEMLEPGMPAGLQPEVTAQVPAQMPAYMHHVPAAQIHAQEAARRSHAEMRMEAVAYIDRNFSVEEALDAAPSTDQLPERPIQAQREVLAQIHPFPPEPQVRNAAESDSRRRFLADPLPNSTVREGTPLEVPANGPAQIYPFLGQQMALQRPVQMPAQMPAQMPVYTPGFPPAQMPAPPLHMRAQFPADIDAEPFIEMAQQVLEQAAQQIPAQMPVQFPQQMPAAPRGPRLTIIPAPPCAQLQLPIPAHIRAFQPEIPPAERRRRIGLPTEMPAEPLAEIQGPAGQIRQSRLPPGAPELRVEWRPEFVRTMVMGMNLGIELPADQVYEGRGGSQDDGDEDDDDN